MVGDECKKPILPSMYQITWTPPELGSGKPAIFSLGASMGGFHKQLSNKKFGGLLRKARWDILDRDPTADRMKAEWSYPHPTNPKKTVKQTMQWMWAKEGGSIERWRFGNCAETYTFIHMLA